MANLSSGVLLKLIRDMKSSSSSDSGFLADDYLSDDDMDDGSSILQVTGIVPALADSDLFPDRGFYLQVSDSSHSTYVSLPPGHDDLILSDNLQLGQLILVRRLEASSPVPILHGLRLIPGRRPFPQHTAAIHATSSGTCSTICPATPERKKRQPRSANTWKMDGRKVGHGMLHSNSCPSSPTKRKEIDRVFSVVRQPMKIGVSHIDEESDESDKSSVITSISNSSSHSFVSMIPRPKTVRKIWEPDEFMKDRKREDKPILKTRSSSTGNFAHYSSCISKGESLEESWAGKRDGEELKVLLSNSAKRKILTASKASTKNPSTTIPLSTYDVMKWPDSNVLWGSLPSNLVKYGKEVLRRRDSALYATLDSLQEACALERLLGCLSTYSELQANKDRNPQKVVDKFLDFHEDLSRAALSTQSLAKTNSSFSQSISTSTIQAAKDASERRKCAASCIKAALKAEVSKSPRITNTTVDPIESSSSDRKPHTSISRQKKSTELSAVSALPTTLNCNIMTVDLAKALQSECNRWFLRYIEKFLDVIHSNRSCKAKESQIASLLCQLKRVDDWLATISAKDKSWAVERSKESFLLEDDDAEACERVRRKIYEILLRHVESAAMALESMSTADEDKVG
ncbi:uncharacterized protein LOC110114586 [Dendrobium catenatum]|uniref:Uncharacterized protein n=1 Tax=Dendrobium catenatum TaxID=906689 RepID=A0A2I0WPX3_9ASPA|nr:uncharacterized protein LOC110114586 [Dendrobium catenatum]PKU77698.1 hypothetical protein MA16_Dca005530 [Dendrobium catenatum]